LKEDFMLTSRTLPHLLVVLFLAFVVAGCSVIGGIFKAGFWTGIFLVAAIAVILMLLVTKMRG
jgi:hypothetical protein